MCNGCEQRIVTGDNEHCLLGNNPDNCDGLPAKSYTSFEDYCNDEVAYANEKVIYFQVNPYAQRIWTKSERQDKINFWQGQANRWTERLKEYRGLIEDGK